MQQIPVSLGILRFMNNLTTATLQQDAQRREMVEDLSKYILEAHEREYDVLVDTWKGLEAKAQATVAIAGIFVGLTLTLARDVPKNGNIYSKCAIVLVTFLLSFAVERAISALRVQNVDCAPSASMTESLVSDLTVLADEPDFLDRRSGFYADCASLWSATIAAHISANERKAQRIAEAQTYLLYAITIASLLVPWTLVTAK